MMEETGPAKLVVWLTAIILTFISFYLFTGIWRNAFS